MNDETIGIVPPDVARTLSGLELLRRMIAGKFPAAPITRTLGFALSEAEEGFAVFTGTPTYALYNPLGGVHGGWIATLLDSCMSCAVHTKLPAGTAYTTLEMKVNFVRGLSDRTGPVRAEGRIIYFGNRTGTAEGKLLDASGKVLAHGTTTCLIFPL